MDAFRAMRSFANSTNLVPKLKFYPCSLPDKTKCASLKELTNANVLYPVLEKLLVSANFSHPVSRFLQNKVVGIDSTVKKINRFEIRLNRIEDHTSIFSGPKTRIEYVTQEKPESDYRNRDHSQMHCEERLIALGTFGGCHEYAYYEYTPSAKVLKITRN